MGDDADIALAQEFGQPLSRFDAARFGKFRRIHPAQANAFSAVSNRVTVHRLDLPAFEMLRHEAKAGQGAGWQLNLSS